VLEKPILVFTAHDGGLIISCVVILILSILMEQGQYGKSKSAIEEKILVTVRLRPLTDKEVNNNDFYAWKCVDDKTVAYSASYTTACPPQFYVYGKILVLHLPVFHLVHFFSLLVATDIPFNLCLW
jgi:hypothetical protein